MRKENNMTIFLTTQYINEAEICDRIGVIDNGEIIALDTPDNLKNLANEDTIEIQTNNNQKSIEEVKTAFPNIFVKQFGKNIIIKTEKGETFLPKVLEAITEEINSINLTKPSLEDIFLKLTGRQIR
ncbi:MAG: DUF4162 domain-containing protein [Candidatus Paceibacterota bacterium]|nr:DUF4162 domain-containing protein [Candidatus Paceibacterota bacterium]